MFRRDNSNNSFMQLKKEQWAKEKAEQENTTEWFPFGSNLRPGGGSPLRKFHPKEPAVSQQKDATFINDNFTDNPRNNEPLEMVLPYETEEEEVHHESPPHQPSYPPPQFLIPAYFPPQYNVANQNQNQAHHQFVIPPQFHAIPSHAIPVSTINIDPNQICPAELQAMWGMTGPNGIRYGIPIPSSFVHQTMASSVSSSESGVSGLTTKRDENQNEKTSHHRDRDFDEMIEEEEPSRKSTGYSTNYEEQIAEKLRYDQAEMEREKLEIEHIERQRREIEARRELEEVKRREAEEQRISEERRRSRQFEEAMEQAKREAELLKKAKLFKHVLKGAEETGELDEIEKKLLGVDVMTGKRLLKEVSDVERHKRQDEQEIRKNAPPSKKSEELPRSRSMSNASVNASPLSRNGFGRRSVRTTSKEKKEQQQEQRTRDEPSNMKSSVYYRPASSVHNLENEEKHGESLRKNVDLSKLFLRSSAAPITSATTSPDSKRNSDELTQSALFGQIPTRLSTRRNNKNMRAPMQIQSPQASYSYRRGRLDTETDDEEEAKATGSISPEFEINHNDSHLPSENTHPSPDSELKEFKFRTRSALGSPSSYLNGGGSLMSSRCASPAGGSSRFLQRLEEKGAVRREEDCLSPSARRLAEETLRRSPSIASLSQSFQNLSNLRGSMLNLSSNGEHSPNLSKLHSMNSPACQSLRVRMQKTSDRQVAVLDRLNRLRDSLNAGKSLSTTPTTINRFGASPTKLPPMSTPTKQQQHHN